MKKKKKNINPLKCGFCQNFKNIPSKQWKTEGSHTNIVRFCKYKNDYVGNTSKICDNFIPIDYIDCMNYNKRVSTIVCINRLNTKKCIRCRLKKVLYEIEKILGGK